MIAVLSVVWATENSSQSCIYNVLVIRRVASDMIRYFFCSSNLSWRRRFKYIDSETFNTAILIQFMDYDSVPSFIFCMKFCFRVLKLCDGRFKGYDL